MTRLARARCACYGCAHLALAYVATMQAVYGDWWAACAFGAASLAPVVSAWMEGEHSVNQHHAALTIYRLATDLDTAERHILHLTEPVIEECCELWWASAGAEHEPECEQQNGRRAA